MSRKISLLVTEENIEELRSLCSLVEVGMILEVGSVNRTTDEIVVETHGDEFMRPIGLRKKINESEA